jgi:glycine betaine/proline transport system permease protein
MQSLPIGETFETFVNWLKDTFRIVFDLFSTVLDFSISLLEDVILLNYENAAASVLFGLVLATLIAFLLKRFVGWKGFFAGFILTAILFGITESWRKEQLNRRLTPELASTMTVHFGNLVGNLESKRPADFSSATDLLHRLQDSLGESDVPASQITSLQEQLSRSIREIEEARSNDFEAVADELALVTEQTGFLPRALREELEQEVVKYEAFILLEDSNRMLNDFADAQAQSRPRELTNVLNLRSYLAYEDLVRSGRIYFDEQGDRDTLILLDEAESAMGLLNPRRLSWYPPVMTGLVLLLVAYLIAGKGIVIFSFIGFFLIVSMGLWEATAESLALVLSATLFALLIGVPFGILAAGSKTADQMIRPVLDLMQTMPAFVYLIPAVIFFGLGKVPGAMATLIFAMPPAVRLTTLGIRQVPAEVVEAAESFGCTTGQKLMKAQLPIALQTILAGVNQTIMLALSMVVIGGMIGAGGLGEVVLSGITQLKLGVGFEGGLAVVILAIYLDRVTQAIGSPVKKKNK